MNVQVIPENLSVTATYPSCSRESEAGSMVTTLETLDTNSFTLYEGTDPEKIEYTPEEIRCNDVMMTMEGQALEEVKEEAIDNHSTALQ